LGRFFGVVPEPTPDAEEKVDTKKVEEVVKEIEKKNEEKK
jgi:hypothetical protein